MNDPYKTLGVAKTASEAEIKKAFRNLAKKHHPDAHPGDEKAKQRFQELSAAYDVIGDKDKRAKFDAGEIDANGNPRGFDPRAYGQQGRISRQSFAAAAAATASFNSAGARRAPIRASAPKTYSPTFWAAGWADAGAAARGNRASPRARIFRSPSPWPSPKRSRAARAG